MNIQIAQAEIQRSFDVLLCNTIAFYSLYCYWNICIMVDIQIYSL